MKLFIYYIYYSSSLFVTPLRNSLQASCKIGASSFLVILHFISFDESQEQQARTPTSLLLFYSLIVPRFVRPPF